MNEDISREIYKKYAAANLQSEEELRKKLHADLQAIHSFEENITLTLFVNFFADIFELANKKAPDKVKLFCNGKFGYPNLEEWKNDVVENPKNFGVQYNYEKENENRDIFVIDLETKRIVYGIITEDKSKNFEWFEERGLAPENQFEKYAVAGSTTRDAEELLKNNWETQQHKTYANHVVESWFGLL